MLENIKLVYEDTLLPYSWSHITGVRKRSDNGLKLSVFDSDKKQTLYPMLPYLSNI